MFFSALLTYVITIIFSKIRTKYISGKKNQYDERNGIKNPPFELRNDVVYSLLLHLIIVIVSKIRIKQQQRRRKNEYETNHNKNLFTSLKGGDNIMDCIEINGVYEIQKESLMVTIRRILNIKNNKVPLFIEPPVLFLAYVLDRNLKNLIVFQGLRGAEIILTNVRSTIAKGTIGVSVTLLLMALQHFTQIPMMPNLVNFGLRTLLSIALLVSNDLKCENYFYKLP